MNDNMSIEDFIRDDETYTEEELDAICTCSYCGNLILPGDDVVGVANGTEKHIIHERCAHRHMGLIDWLDILDITYYNGVAEDVDGYLNGDILLKFKKRKVFL